MAGRLTKFVGAWRYLWITVPVILMLAFTIAMESLVSTADNVWFRGLVAGATGVVGFVVIFTAVRWISSRLQIPAPIVTGWRGLVTGLAVGLVLSVTCGLIFSFLHGESVAITFSSAIQPAGFLRNLGPAFIEEASMRAGVVHILNGLNGSWAAMAGGSLPFGLLHVFGRLFGNPVGISLVVGKLLADFCYRSCTFVLDSGPRSLVTGSGIHWPVHGLCTLASPREMVSNNLRGRRRQLLFCYSPACVSLHSETGDGSSEPDRKP